MTNTATAPGRLCCAFPDPLKPNRKLLNVGMCTVYELLRSNQLKHARIGVQYRILKQDVLAFMDQGSQAAKAV